MRDSSKINSYFTHSIETVARLIAISLLAETVAILTATLLLYTDSSKINSYITASIETVASKFNSFIATTQSL